MNSVCIVGNLTADPELRHTASGAAVCNMRIAVNDRRREGDEWVDVPYFFNVTAWSGLAERCAEWLTKGKKIGVTGKLTWREWESQDGQKRQTVEINAFNIDFLTPRGDTSMTLDTEPVTAPVFAGRANPDDDIPF